MTDAKTQLVRLGAHLDDTVPPIDDAELVQRIAVLENASYRPSRKPRAGVIALTAAGAALLLIGAVPLVLSILRTDASSPADAPPAPSVVSTAAPSSTAPPATTSPATTGTEPAPPSDAASMFDYAAAGEPAGTLETEVGNLEFFALRSVPYQWIDDGFPVPGSPRPDHEFRTIWGNAHSGLEVFATDAGYLGLGSTTGPDEPRIMTGYLGSFFRVRGVGTQAEFEEAFHEGTAGVDYEYWGEDNGMWGGSVESFLFAPSEVWLSTDGVAWDQMAASPFGTDAVMASQPRSVAEHDGTWMALGWSGVDDLDELPGTTSAVPAVWTSDNLETWSPVPFDFAAPGWDTTLESVVGSDGGWLVAGKRTSHETPRAYDSVVWFSRNGVDWLELPMAELVGLPQCGPFERPEKCLAGFDPEFVPGGIGLYVWHNSLTGRGWSLWIGVWDD